MTLSHPDPSPAAIAPLPARASAAVTDHGDAVSAPLRSRQRIPAIDALRGLAALAVVLFHYTFGYANVVGAHTSAVPVFAMGHFGVDLFFIISGFVIAGTLERTPTLRRFAVQRLARLYPAFLVCSLLALSFVTFGDMNPLGLTGFEALASLTMLSWLFGLTPIDPSTWTLSHEISFYVLVALAVYRVKVRNLETFCGMWLVGSLLAVLLSLPMDHQHLTTLFNVGYVNLFVVGMLLWRSTTGSLSRVGRLVLALALALTWLGGPRSNPSGASPDTYMVLVLACTGLVWAAAAGRLRFLQWAPLLFLGEISYALYLVHQMPGYWIIRRLEASGVAATLAVGCALAVAIAAAAMIRSFVEIPAQRWIRDALEGRRPHPKHLPLPQSMSSTASPVP